MLSDLSMGASTVCSIGKRKRGDMLTQQPVKNAEGKGQQDESYIPIVFCLHNNHANEDEDDAIRCGA